LDRIQASKLFAWIDFDCRSLWRVLLDFLNRFMRDPHHQNQAGKPAKDFEKGVGWHGAGGQETQALSLSCSQITNETYPWINRKRI
jgi:hypothetical protein